MSQQKIIFHVEVQNMLNKFILDCSLFIFIRVKSDEVEVVAGDLVVNIIILENLF